jgi:antitoxin PrlF
MRIKKQTWDGDWIDAYSARINIAAGRMEISDNDAELLAQITIPKVVRYHLHLKERDHMTFTLLPDGTVLMRVKNKSAMEIAGRLHKKGRKPLPIEGLSR